jgi:hypothetical protein
MANGISWKEFEAIVGRLQKTFHRNGGKVTTNEKIMGKISGRTRQIDICIRSNMGGENVLIIVECKKWNRKPDVKAVEAFAGVKKDVGAHIGIMVSTAGFTKAAFRVAEHENINLYKYTDTQKDNWPNGLETSVLLEIWELTPTAAYYVLADGSRETIESDEDLDFFDRKGGEQSPVPLATIIRKVWESFDAADKREWNWLSEFECTTPERPEIQKLGFGAQSRFVRGIRKGRVHFEGFIDEREGHAKVEGWKMVFDGEMIPWPKEKPLPNSETYTILLSSVFVRTQNTKSETLQELVYKGILELTVEGKDVIKLPMGKKTSLNLSSVRSKPFKQN